MVDEGKDSAGKIVRKEGRATLVFRRELAHPAEMVWNALTDPEQLSKWYMTTARIDGRVGGTIDFISGPSRLHITGEILEWDPPRVFEHEWTVDPVEEIPLGEKAVIRWTLEPSDNGTMLRLEHRNLSIRTAEGFAPGTHSFLDRLQAQLSGDRLPGWQQRYMAVSGNYPSSWVGKK